MFSLENPDYSQSLADTFWIGDATGVHKQLSLLHVIPQQTDYDVYFDTAYYEYIHSVSATGFVAFRTNKAMFVENVLTGQTIELPAVSRIIDEMTVQWSPDGGRGILTDGDNVWLVSPDTTQITYLTALFNHTYNSSDAPQPVWSPNGHHALILSGDTLYHLNVATAQLDKIPIAGQWIYWSWQSDTVAFIYAYPAYEAPQLPALLIDFATGASQSVPIPDQLFSAQQPKLSPDARRVLMISEGPVLYDIQKHQTQRLRPPAGSYEADGGGEVLWNKDSQWALTFTSGAVAGGGFCCRHLGIVRADGQYQRDLSFVLDAVTSISLNWLPSQVHSVTLSPALTKPLFAHPKQILTGQDWSFGLIWSPDGKRLLSENGQWPPTTVQLWDTASRQATPIPLRPDDTHNLGWTQNAQDEFVPALMPVTPSQRSSNDLYPIAYSPDRTQVVTNGTDKFPPGVYNTTTHTIIHRFDEIKSTIFSASYSLNGRLLAVASPFESAYIWDTTTWNVVATLPEIATSVAFSPDGKQIAAGTSWNVNLYDVRDLITASLCTQQNACF